MSKRIRSTTPGSKWTQNELDAYNIVVTHQNVAGFFGNPLLPQPTISAVILDNLEPPNGIIDQTDHDFFFYLNAAMAMQEESAVDDFGAHILRLLQYESAVRFIRQRKDLPLFMCGGRTNAKTNVCVIDGESTIFLLQEDKTRRARRQNPEAQLIAQAIAAFQDHNRRLQKDRMPTINTRTIPGITMVNTAPTFYKITITQDLVDAVETAQYPKKLTTVHKLVPPVDNPDRLIVDGMRPLNNRRVILQCFEALKQFL